MKRKSVAIIFLILGYSFGTYAQENNFRELVGASVELDGIATSGKDVVPFWMRTNKFGNIPLAGVSASLGASFYKKYRNEFVWSDKKVDWQADFEGRLNIGQQVNYRSIQGAASLKYRIFQLQAGRTRSVIGLVDSSLSSGAFSQSGNALGIPCIIISVPRFQPIAFTKNFVAVKGNFGFGKMGMMNLNENMNPLVDKVSTYFHQKSIYVRLGKPQSKVKLYGGFNHQVYFGNEKDIFGGAFDLSWPSELFYVVTGKAYRGAARLASKIGNHNGSIDQMITLSSGKYIYSFYHQFFYEAGGLIHLANATDGLWGINLENKETNSHVAVKKILAEFWYSKNQGGELNSIATPSGAEDYYNNYLYTDGWTYKGENMGNNFLTNARYARTDLETNKTFYVVNNRVALFHLGANLKITQWDVTTFFSYSRNYGTYSKSPAYKSLNGIIVHNPPPYFSPANQFSGYIEASRPLKNNFRIGFVLAGDYGDLLYNSIGGMVKLTRTW